MREAVKRTDDGTDGVRGGVRRVRGAAGVRGGVRRADVCDSCDSDPTMHAYTINY